MPETTVKGVVRPQARGLFSGFRLRLASTAKCLCADNLRISPAGRGSREPTADWRARIGSSTPPATAQADALTHEDGG